MDQKSKAFRGHGSVCSLGVPQKPSSRVSRKLAEVKQASIEPAGLHLKIQKGQVKQMEVENSRTGTELMKKISKRKRIYMLKVQQDIKAFLQPEQKLEEVPSSKVESVPEPFFYIPDELLVELDV